MLLLAVLLMGCSGDYMHSYQSVGGAWSKCDTLSFPANWYRSVGGQQLDIYLGVRYTTAYPYKNLCVQLEAVSANDSLLSCDTICCDIYDDAGYRNGTTAGVLYQADFFVSTVSLQDSCYFRLQHMMQDSLLSGVYDIGIRVVSPYRRRYAGN